MTPLISAGWKFPLAIFVDIQLRLLWVLLVVFGILLTDNQELALEAEVWISTIVGITNP